MYVCDMYVYDMYVCDMHVYDKYVCDIIIMFYFCVSTTHIVQHTTKYK